MNSSKDIPVVTIDGPAGSGKGTIAQLVARKLGWKILDSGALYRLVALAAQRQGVDLDSNNKSLADIAKNLDVIFTPCHEGGVDICLEGDDENLPF